MSQRISTPPPGPAIGKWRGALTLWFAVGVVLTGSSARAATNHFAAGLTAYNSGQFAAAAREFRLAGSNAPALGTFLNLGLSEWRRGRAGAAICAWEQARWLAPRDPTAAASLAYARRLLDLEAPSLPWPERVATQLPADAWTWISALGLWLTVLAFVLPEIRRRPRSTGTQALAALGLTMLVLSLPAHWGVHTRQQIGFVLQREASLRLTPTTESEVIAKLPAGEPGRQLRVRGNHVLIKTARGEGWLERRQFGLVVPDR